MNRFAAGEVLGLAQGRVDVEGGELAVGWLDQQRADTPFFLYFAPVAIHFPYTPSNQTKGASGIGLYGDWIHELDLSVGRILDKLRLRNNSDMTRFAIRRGLIELD